METRETTMTPEDIKKRLEIIKPMLERGYFMQGAWHKHAPWLVSTLEASLKREEIYKKAVSELKCGYTETCPCCEDTTIIITKALQAMDEIKGE